MSRSVICQRCKSLVAVEGRRWMAHAGPDGEQCPISNTIYRAPVIHRTGGGRPTVEVLGARSVECPECHEPGCGLEVLVRVSGQKAGSN